MDETVLRRLLAAGETVDLRDGDPERDDPTHAESWGRERDVPAALVAELVTVESELRPPVRQLRLAGARITGTLDLNTAILTRRVTLQECAFDEPPALSDAELIGLDLGGCHVPGIVGDRLHCRGNVAFGDGFAASGEVRLAGARIGGQLDCSGGVFRNPDGVALKADRIEVHHSVFCADGFAATGGVRLAGARIGGQLACRGGSFRAPNGTALELERAEVQENVLLGPDAIEGSIGLRHASVAAWYDNELARSRPTDLHGFRYGSIYSDADEHGGPELRERLRWVERNTPMFDPQPYEQLASVHGEEGNHVATRRVQIAKQRRRRANHPNPLRRWPAVIWSEFLRVTVGYGYRPWLVLWPMAVLLGLGTWLFGREHAAGRLMAASGGGVASGAGEFSAVRYTLDLLLPVIGLRADGAYAPVGATAWYTFGFTCTGWLLAFVLVAGLTGVFKRRS